jgi:predicted acylesterase/phospholipase RssA
LWATTNLDANRGVIWNIGAIAASGDPGSLDLIHNILIASAAIPAAFPPVMFDVEVNGKGLSGDARGRRRQGAGLPVPTHPPPQ